MDGIHHSKPNPVPTPAADKMEVDARVVPVYRTGQFRINAEFNINTQETYGTIRILLSPSCYCCTSTEWKYEYEYGNPVGRYALSRYE